MKFIFTMSVATFLLAWFASVSESAPPKETTSTPKNIQQTTSESSASQSQKNRKKNLSKPPQFSKLKKTAPVKGYCCVAGAFYSKTTERDCQRKKGSYSDTQNPLKENCGWCCKTGRVRSVNSSKEKRKLCGDPKNLYSSQRLAKKNCGWCCKNRKIFAVTSRSQCNQNGFKKEKSEAEELCKPPTGYCNLKGVTLKKRITQAACERQKGAFYQLFSQAQKALFKVKREQRKKDTIKQKAGSMKGNRYWCCANKPFSVVGRGSIVAQVTKGECKTAGGSVYKSKAEANKACGLKIGLLSGKKIMAPQIAIIPKNEGEKSEDGNARKQAGSIMKKRISKSSSLVQKHIWASSLPLEIAVPMEDQAYQRGDTMQVRYKINTPTEAGTVAFRLLSSAGEELSTTSHEYVPPDLSSVDLSEAEIEPAGSGFLGSVDDDPADRPLGTGERQFSWPLPADLVTPLGTTLYITANKEGLSGRSGNFHVQPEYFGEIRVSTPNGGEHWEACGSPAIRWHYFDDPATMPAEWEVELVRGGARQYLVRSRCTEYVDHSDVYPPYRECIERTPRPCLESGTYRARVTGGGLTDQSDASFRIGITEEWPMLSLTSPGGGRVYSKEGTLPIGFYSTSEFNAEIKIIKGGVLIKDSFNRDDVTTHHEAYVIPEHFPDGDNYTVQVSDRDNPYNSVESSPFTISGGTVDFSIMDIGSTDGRNLYADIRIESPESGTPFSRRVRFSVWRPYRSWTVIRDLSGPGGRVDLGDLNLPADMTGYPCGVDYTVTVDGPNEYEEVDEGNNTMTKEVAYTADRGYVTLYQTPGREIDTRTFRCGKEPDGFNGNRHGFFIRLKNCGVDTATGYVSVRQVGSWPNEPHGFSVPRDFSIFGRFITVGPNETETIEIWNDGSNCWDSTLEFHFDGDFAPWVLENPLRVDLDVSYISR